MAKKKHPKIVRYRKPPNINVGMIIFAIIFLYMAFSVYTYLGKEKIQFYEVTEGSIVDNKSYTGIILREETVQYADRSGYINYYIREGKRASVGTPVYSLDETGNMTALLAASTGSDAALTDENLISLKKQLSSFSQTYEDQDFDEIYDTRYEVEAAVLEYVNSSAMDQLDELMEQQGISFHQVTASRAGIVSYAIDSYEDLTETAISAEVFDESTRQVSLHKSGDLIEQQTPVYKIITSDQWSLIFPLTESDLADYQGRSSLQISFSGEDLTVSGQFSVIAGTDGGTYGKLMFDKYMVQFTDSRYLDFEVVTSQSGGLKIPASSVTEKTFYLAPTDFLTKGGDSSDSGFMKEVYSETGTSYLFVPTTLYYEKDGYYYIELGADGQLQAGDYIVKPDSSERYQLGSSAVLQGAYNINKGYAVFKQIDVLSSNDEYYTIQKNTSYGLSVYDHIVLDATTVYEGQFIYQ